MRPVFWIVENF